MQKILIYTLFLLLSSPFAMSADASSPTVDLQTGWNLVYGFLYTTQIQTSQSTVLAKNIKAIYAFIPTKQQYARVYPDPSETDVVLLQSIDDDELVQTAFWVSTTKPGKLIHNFIDTPASVDGRKLYKGWNFVGVTADMIESPTRPNLTFDNLKGNCVVEKSYVFLEGQWVAINPVPMEDNLLNSGVVIKVSNACQLGTDSKTLPLPPVTP